MKIYTLATSVLALALITSAQADVTVDITGATAFRVATLDSIKGRFVASGQPFKYAHDKTAGGFNGATLSVFIGTFPGVSGVTTIRTSFNGSVEGINALVNSPAADPQYLNPSVLDSVTATVGGAELPSTTSPKAASQSEIAFSDVSVAATPFSGASLLPANSEAGVVVFTMIANESCPAALTSVTTKQFQALYANGFQPLSIFTGDAAHSGTFVFATGRNDGSGTRTTYLAETGYGITTPVNQYIVTNSTSSEITEIQRVPAGGNFTPALTGTVKQTANASTIWGQDIDGNGGYSSGSALRTDLGKITPAVQVYDADNTDLGVLPLTLISWLSAGDAVPARVAGAKILGYNGVTLESLKTASVLDATDRAKITEGQYTGWSYQQMYRRGDLSTGDAVTVYDGIKNNLVLGATGIPIADMHVGRTVDGGIVAP